MVLCCFFNQPAFYLSDCHDQGSDSHPVTETLKIHTPHVVWNRDELCCWKAAQHCCSRHYLRGSEGKNKQINMFLIWPTTMLRYSIVIITMFLLGNEALSLAPGISGHNLWNFMTYSFHNLHSKALFSVPPFLASVYMSMCVCLCLSVSLNVFRSQK